ncbi:MAG TPA: MMPL family transporter [Labilithrix sp.]|nr:MMPL family transporter [Labilithrix sp.]
MKAKAQSLLVMVVITSLLLFVLPRLHVTTAITAFLPEAADRRAAALLKGIAEGESASTLVLDVSGAPPERLGLTASKLVERLRDDRETKSVRSGMDADAQARIVTLLSQRSSTALLAPEDLVDEAVRVRLERLKARLGSPLGPFVRQLAPRDPLGGVFDLLDEMSDFDGGRLTSHEGVLFTADEQHAFVFTVTRASAFNAEAQRGYLARIDEAFRSVRGSPDEQLEISGIGPMTVAAEAQIRGDIERIGGISTIGILLLFALLFGSVRMVGLGLVPLFVGTALAIVVCHAVFPEIQGLTLAFGTSILGVGIDYAEHYFSHFSLNPERGAESVMRTIWPGLWLGAVTTLVGFGGAAASGFPGAVQMGVFSAVAIVGALFATRYLVPPWMPRTYARPRLMVKLSSIAERIMDRAARRRWLKFLPVVLTLALVPGFLQTTFIDDVSQLIALDPKALAEDARVRARLSPSDPGRFVVVVRKDEDAALAALERTTAALDKARSEGLVAGFPPLARILRSRTRQAASFERARAQREVMIAAMREQGFVPEAFAPFFEELDKPTPAPLTLGDLRASPFGAMLEPLAPRLPEGQAFVLPLRGVRDRQALADRLPDAVLIDEPAMLEGAYREVRKATVSMLALGLVLVFGTLLLRYRSMRVALAAFVPAVLGAAGAVSVIGALGMPLNMFHVVALLLVLSMGVDYGIFVVEGRGHPEARASSLVSIVTATSTTLLSFGLLGTSPHPALRALGVTITLGLLLTTLLCPIGLAIAPPEKGEVA